MTSPAAAFRLLLVSAGAGSLGALGALGLDLTLVRWLTASPTPLGLPVALAYAGTGAALGLGLGPILLRRVEGTSGDAGKVAAGAFALLYAIPVGERLVYQLVDRGWLTVLGTVVGLGAYLGLVGALALLARGPDPSPADRAVGPVLAGLCASAGLLLNRFAVERAFSLEALALDATVVVSVVVLSLLARRVGGGRLLGFLAAAVAIAAVSGTLRSGPVPAEATPPAAADLQRPHLLLLVLDTLRQDVFADALATTPEGDRLRRALGGGTMFTEAVGAAPWTAPSMGSILTGLYPEEHGFLSSTQDRRDWAYRRLSPDVTTLAERLRDRGWWPEAIGANPILPPETGIARGFEEYRLLSGPTVRLPLATALSRIGWLAADYYQPAPALEKALAARLPVLAESARPLFLWLQLMDPHHPLHRRSTFAEDLRLLGAGREMEAEYRSEVRFGMDRAAAMVERIDRALGRESVAVVLTSDHGEMLPSDRPGARRTEPTYGHGHVLYEPVMRVPLVLRPAGGGAGLREVPGLVHHVDLHDTMLDLVGLDDAPRIGRDRRSAVGREDGPYRPWALLGSNHHGPPQQALRTPELKLIVWPGGESGPELYDLRSDPDETDDLAGRDPDRLRKLLEVLAERRSVVRPLGESASEVPLDDATRKQLEALGYTGN